jgi:hypothetical protein
MGKRSDISQLAIFLALTLSHKIGSIVEPDGVYNEKYKKESNSYFERAEVISLRRNWSSYDKREIRKELEKKLRIELEKKDFLDNKKFDIMEEEMNKVLGDLGLN